MAVNTVLFSDPGCSIRARQGVLALYETGLLEAYITTIAYSPDALGLRALRAIVPGLAAKAEQTLMRRHISEVPQQVIENFAFLEMIRVAAHYLHVGAEVEDFFWDVGIQAFDGHVANQLSHHMKAVYATDFAALKTFEVAQSQGITCIYCQPSVHYQTMAGILDAEYAAHPEVMSGYDVHVRPMAAQRNERRNKEQTLANATIVSSSFARDSLIAAGIPAERIYVVPLGAPLVDTKVVMYRKPLIFLSAGNQAVHKGTHYLLEAWRRLRPGAGVELWLVGRMHLPERLLANLPGTVVIKPTVPRDELYALYRRAGALVFPTLCDGFGAVITEAMAHGLPVITTAHSAGPDIITHGVDGMLIPAKDADALAAAIQWCIDNPADLVAMGDKASQRVAQMQWGDFRRRFVTTINAILANQSGSY